MALISPYCDENWLYWINIINSPLNDEEDFERIVSTLHKDKYAPRLFSDFLRRYFDDDDSGVFGLVASNKDHKIDRERFFRVIVPFIKDLVNKLSEFICTHYFSNLHRATSVQPDILADILSGKITYPLDAPTVVIPRTHVAGFLANSFFGIYDLYESRNKTNVMNDESNLITPVNFLNLIKCGNISAFESVINYFDKLTSSQPAGNIIIKRINKTRSIIPATNSPIPPVKIYTSGRAEYSQAPVHILLVKTSLHDTINNIHSRFLIHPELFILTILSNSIGKRESIIVTGLETFSVITATDGVKYAGKYDDISPRARDGTISRSIAFIHDSGEDSADSYLNEFKHSLNMMATVLNAIIPMDLNNRIDVSVGPCTELQFIKLMFACNTRSRINYYKNTHDANETARIASDGNIANIVSFIQDMIKRKAITRNMMLAYDKFSQELKRDRDNNYGEFNIKTLSVFKEIKKRIE